MSNVSVQTQRGRSDARGTEVEGFRSLRHLLQWDPFSGASWLTPSNETHFAPAFEVKETRDAFIFKADLPGVELEQVDVKLTDQRLTISGRREAESQERGETYYAYERSYGAFSRSFTLPRTIDGERIDAKLAAGVLTVVVPKRADAQPRKVEIKTG